MILWNLISIAIIAAIVIEAKNAGWGLPKFVSFATIGACWFAGSLGLWVLQ